MNTQSLLASELRDKEYRDAHVASRLRISLPRQCRALRESREMTQPELALAAGMSQPRISEIERPGERKLALETLLRLASAFDVALQVRFVPFTEFVDDNDTLDLDNFHVPTFEEDMAALEIREEQMKSVTPIKSKIEDLASRGREPQALSIDRAGSMDVSQQPNEMLKAIAAETEGQKAGTANAA